MLAGRVKEEADCGNVQISFMALVDMQSQKVLEEWKAQDAGKYDL